MRSCECSAAVRDDCVDNGVCEAITTRRDVPNVALLAVELRAPVVASVDFFISSRDGDVRVVNINDAGAFERSTEIFVQLSYSVKLERAFNEVVLSDDGFRGRVLALHELRAVCATSCSMADEFSFSEYACLL